MQNNYLTPIGEALRRQEAVYEIGRRFLERERRRAAAARVWRAACWVIAGFAFIVAAGEVGWFIANRGPVGVDWDIYRAAAQRWLGGGSYFLPSQLAGPHPLTMGDVLYPPSALALFVPFSFLPDALWYIVPLAIIGAALAYLRPAPWAWAVIGVLGAFPLTLSGFLCGNPFMWMVAALFAWAAWRSPASLVLLKPTLAPFALAGFPSRRWWLGVALLAAPTLALLPLTLTWVQVVLNTTGTSGAAYSLAEWPAMLIPLVAWAGSTSRSPMRVSLPRLPALHLRLSPPR